jgi:putative endonuclease
MSGYYVYIMASKRNGTLYTGMTGKLAQRTSGHKQRRASAFTKKYAVKKLVYYEKHDDEQKARMREKQIKRWKRKWKLRLIEEVNPRWKDLADDLDTKEVPCPRHAGRGWVPA